MIAGVTYHQSFPVTLGAYDTTFNGSTDMFVTVFDPNRISAAQNVASTFLGGSGNERWPYDLTKIINMSIGDVAIARDGTIAVVGRTASLNFPTQGAFQTAFAGGPGADMFVTRLKADLTAVLYSTYLGGTDDDGAMMVVEDAAGDLCVAGFTWSPGSSFPTTAGAPQRNLAGGNDGVLAVLRTAGPGQGLLYSTLVGGNNPDGFAALVVEDSGVITAAGWSGGFAGTSGAWQPTGSPRDSLIARLDPRGQGVADLHYVSSFGGPGGAQEYALDIASHGDGLITIAGMSDATPLWTSFGALQRAPGGGIDAFVCSFDPLTTFKA